MHREKIKPEMHMTPNSARRAAGATWRADSACGLAMMRIMSVANTGVTIYLRGGGGGEEEGGGSE